MIPLVRSIVHALLWDAMAARRWLRGLAVTFSIGGVAFADQVAVEIGHGVAGRTVKVIALVLAFIGGSISVGQQNPKPEGHLVPIDRARGFVIPGLVVMLAIGFGIYLYAMAHAGAR